MGGKMVGDGQGDILLIEKQPPQAFMLMQKGSLLT